MNGHIVSEKQGYAQCCGGHRLSMRNDNRCHILDCGKAHILAVINMYFKKRPTQLVTYSSGSHETHIDCWMVQGRNLLVTKAAVHPVHSVSEFIHSFSFTPSSELYEWTNVGNSEWEYRGDFRYSLWLGLLTPSTHMALLKEA